MKKHITGILAMLLCMIMVGLLFGCGNNNKALRIDVPEETQEEYIGLYVIPIPRVVNTLGEFMVGRTVQLKSVKGPEGADLTVENGMLNVEVLGTYTFTYTAQDANDADMRVNFSYAPPTVTAPSGMPESYVSGQWYLVPNFRVSNGTITGTKLFHEEDEGMERSEISLTTGFNATFVSGYYVFVVSAVSPEGVSKDFEFRVLAERGPSAVIPGKVAYLDQEMGLSHLRLTNLSGSYDTENTYKNEEVSTKLTFTSSSGYKYARTLNPWISDISSYDYLVIRIRNNNEQVMWFMYDTWNTMQNYELAPGEWTEIVWDLSQGFPGSGASTSNIKNLDLHFFLKSDTADPTSPFNDNMTPDGKYLINIPSGWSVNLSAMYALNFDGPSEMALTAGYAAAVSPAFTIDDYYDVQKTSGNAAITWDDANKRFNVAPGLTEGIYPVELELFDEEGNTALTHKFVVTVS